MTKPTPEQLANLKNHANFLRNLPPPKENKFSMDTFYNVLDEFFLYEDIDYHPNKPSSCAAVGQPACGFSACALGWTIMNPDLPKAEQDEDWAEYSRRVFGLGRFDEGIIKFGWNSELEKYFSGYRYCFFSHWDEDEHAAAARMMKVYEYYNV